MSAAVGTSSDLWSPVIDHILRAQKIVLTTHENSDGDGLGSQTALYNVLRQLGKDVTIVNATVIPKNYRFLIDLLDENNSDTALIYDGANTVHVEKVEQADLAFVLDTNRITRTKAIRPRLLAQQAAGKTKLICIDHHLEPEDFADICICLDYASATGELVYELIKHLEVRTGKSLLGKTAATGLYTAIMTDTGSFKFPKTTAHVHHIIAELIERGASPTDIFDKVFNTQTEGSLKLAGMSVEGIHLAEHGHIAYLSVSQQMLRDTDTGLSDTEKLTDYLMSMPKTKIGMMFIELPDGSTKASFRSRGDIFVNRLAGNYGGGGHKNAAGCVMPLALADAIPAALEKAKQLLD